MDIDIPGQTLKLEEFDIKTLIKDNDGTYIHPRIVMIAPSGSGKSWIVRNILYEMRDIPCGVVLAPTDKMNKFYNDYAGKIWNDLEKCAKNIFSSFETIKKKYDKFYEISIRYI